MLSSSQTIVVYNQIIITIVYIQFAFLLREKKAYPLPYLISVVHGESHTARVFKLEHRVLHGFSPIVWRELDLQLTGTRHHKVSGLVLEQWYGTSELPMLSSTF